MNVMHFYHAKTGERRRVKISQCKLRFGRLARYSRRNLPTRAEAIRVMVNKGFSRVKP